MYTPYTVRLQLVGCLSAAVAVDQVHSNRRSTLTNKRTTCSPSTVSKQNHFACCIVAETGERMKIDEER